ncbi:MAG: cytochrome c3 family protein [Candidatus Kapabacteria bacterium]|nr:cytochrome c3 family protein [Candidatus Kapabacteria bacterium]
MRKLIDFKKVILKLLNNHFPSNNKNETAERYLIHGSLGKISLKGFSIICLIFISFGIFALFSNPLLPHKEVKKSQKTVAQATDWKNIHSKGAINCKTCHNCEYPTKKDPCLINCPKNEMISIYHAPSEGPEIVIIDELRERYSKVVFSHKQHAQMSAMSTGCGGCHHYNTTGPILNCKKCHEVARKRENISLPDLQGAIHRQCMNCHRQWSKTNSCENSCHVPIDKDSEARTKDQIKRLEGKIHPEVPFPKRMIWTTNYEKGQIVTFYHDEHSGLFNIDCKTCHLEDNCVKCHNKTNTVAKFEENESIAVKHTKTHEDHHKPCGNCHKDDKCSKCHSKVIMNAFDHLRSTGWALKSFHSDLECEKCHVNQSPPHKIKSNCNSCHSTWTLGKFKHERTGLALSKSHIEMDCESCHENKIYSDKPICSSCHDDKNYPKHLPGNYISRLKVRKVIK